jgi:hypothetical protein
MPNQGYIISGLNRFLRAKHMPLVMNPRGICSGLVIKYLVACGKYKRTEFFEELNSIANLSRTEFDRKEVQTKLFSRDVEYSFQPDYYQAKVR